MSQLDSDVGALSLCHAPCHPGLSASRGLHLACFSLMLCQQFLPLKSPHD